MSGKTAHFTMCNTQGYRTHDYTRVCSVFKRGKQKIHKKYVCKEPNNLIKLHELPFGTKRRGKG